MLEGIKQIGEGIHLRLTIVVKREVQLDKGMMSVWCSKMRVVSVRCADLMHMTFSAVLHFILSYESAVLIFVISDFVFVILCVFISCISLIYVYLLRFSFCSIFVAQPYEFSWYLCFVFPDWLAMFGIAYYYHPISAAYSM